MGGAADYRREVRITLVCLAFTFVAWLGATWDTGGILVARLAGGEVGASVEQIVFIVIVQGLIYGNFIYQFTRLGYLRRRLAHRPAARDEREALYEGGAPALTILVPSYKEGRDVVRRTLLSAALQDYPNRRVVLLIDDPHQPANPADAAALAAMRRLPAEIQRLLDDAAATFGRAEAAFLARSTGKYMSGEKEGVALAGLYDQAALWLESLAGHEPAGDHAQQHFADVVLGRAARAHRERAHELRALGSSGSLNASRVRREYRRLAALFKVELASFERKRYANLSHEPNKAMNLNSYIALIGGRWQETMGSDGIHLEQAPAGATALQVPSADFLITLDADSLLVPEYAILLVNEMLRPGRERLAVAQTPYNTMPGAPGLLERVAGATTDIQYLIHQGFTRFDATYWVGANALLRMSALQDIRETVRERGHEVSVFIQDRTVIEDTESSVDLVARGWTLYNYPERLAFSATPPDFGSLLIQRRRWANGGLIILPKLLRYLAGRPHHAGKLVEGFFRTHYLASIALVNAGLLILLGHDFDQSMGTWWLPLTALPYFALYGRDLRYSGYPLSDLARVYALNLLLIPVNLGGVFKSVQQGVTGRRIPFGRTPKVSRRTAVARPYVLAEYALLAAWLGGTALDAAAGRWFSALFGLANALMLAYAIVSFLGLRESLEDLGLTAARTRPAEVLPVPFSDRALGLAPGLEVVTAENDSQWRQGVDRQREQAARAPAA